MRPPLGAAAARGLMRARAPWRAPRQRAARAARARQPAALSTSDLAPSAPPPRSKRLEGNVKKFEKQGEQVKEEISKLQRANQQQAQQ